MVHLQAKKYGSNPKSMITYLNFIITVIMNILNPEKVFPAITATL